MKRNQTRKRRKRGRKTGVELMLKAKDVVERIQRIEEKYVKDKIDQLAVKKVEAEG